HRRFGILVYNQPEDVRARIMPDHVEVVFPSSDVVHVNFCSQYALALVVGACQYLASGADNGASALHQHGVGLIALDGVIVFRKSAASNVLAGRENEAAAFHRHVLHRRDPFGTIIGGGGAVKLDTFAVHRHTHERHVVFPADHRTELPERCIEYGHGGPIAVSPYQAFHGGGHEFAMHAEQLAFGREVKRGAVERPNFFFHHPDHDICTGLARSGADLFCLGPGNFDGAVEIAYEFVAAARQPPSDAGSKVAAFGISGHCGFWEHDQTSACSGRLMNLLDYLL